MRKQNLSKQFSFVATATALLVGFPQQGWSNGPAQLEPGASGNLSKLDGAQAKCTETSHPGTCTQCKTQLDKTKSSTGSTVKAAIKEDAAGIGGGVASSGAAGASDKAAANGLLGDAGIGTGGGGAGAGGRSAAASKAAAAFKKCSDELGICKGIADDAIQACEAGAAGAGAAAADQAKAAGEMGGMADALKQAAGMLGPLMEAMKGKDEPPKSSNITPPKVAEKPQQIAGTSLAGNGKEAVKGITIGNSDPGKNSSGSGEEGLAPVNMAGFATTPEIDSSLGGESLDNGGGGGPTIASVAPSGGGGLGGSNSSGASMMGDVPAGEAAKAGVPDGFGEYSLAGGGGGSRSSFLGLKGKTDEGVAGEESAEENPLDALGVDDEGERSLASEDPGVRQDQTGNLFSVIHSKLREIKLKGNI